jgi:hypothetical protein
MALRFLYNNLKEDIKFDISLYEACNLFVKSYIDLSPQTIINCWKKTGIYINDNIEEKITSFFNFRKNDSDSKTFCLCDEETNPSSCTHISSSCKCFGSSKEFLFPKNPVRFDENKECAKICEENDESDEENDIICCSRCFCSNSVSNSICCGFFFLSFKKIRALSFYL